MYVQNCTVKLFKTLETGSTLINLSFHHIFTYQSRFYVNARTTLIRKFDWFKYIT